MQHFKHLFTNSNYRNTFANIQKCFRTNDLNELSDKKHHLVFDMIGFFSFQEKSVEYTVEFFLEFLRKLDLTPDYLTVHPNKYNDWKHLYPNIKMDSECVWSDGNIGGYCTEMYIEDIEIGNIVNTLDKSIDVGFGLQRIENVLTKTQQLNELTILKESIEVLLNEGIKPEPKKHGYILRKIIRKYFRLGGIPFSEELSAELEKYSKLKSKYEMLKVKHKDKPSEWWFDTHGIILEDFNTLCKEFHK